MNMSEEKQIAFLMKNRAGALESPVMDLDFSRKLGETLKREFEPQANKAAPHFSSLRVLAFLSLAAGILLLSHPYLGHIAFENQSEDYDNTGNPGQTGKINSGPGIPSNDTNSIPGILPNLKRSLSFTITPPAGSVVSIDEVIETRDFIYVIPFIASRNNISKGPPKSQIVELTLECPKKPIRYILPENYTFSSENGEAVVLNKSTVKEIKNSGKVLYKK